MKFPLSANMFPPIRLTPQQCVEFEELAETVVAETLAEYDTFNRQHRRQLSKLQWKPVKKRDNITVYSERCVRTEPTLKPTVVASTPTPTTVPSTAHDFTASGSFDLLADDFTTSGRSTMRFTAPVPLSMSSSAFSTSGQRRLPQLLAVGSVAGTIEDMVYGMSSPTAAHIMIKSAYTHGEVLDAKVLFEIKSPTPDDPLRFLGLKWIVKGHSRAIGALVRPRDLVFVESAGIQTRADGSRLGFFVVHSVELRECRHLDELSIVRARTSSCYLFTQRGSHVDVFMKSFVEPNGNISDAVAVRTVANTLVSVARAEECAHNRKMGWDVTKRLRYPADSITPPPCVADSASHTTCSLCSKPLSRLSLPAACYFCSALACAKCSEQRTLTLPSSAAVPTARAGKLVKRMSLNACTRCCTTQFRFQDAVLVARQEILEGEYGSAPQALERDAADASRSIELADTLQAQLASRTLASEKTGSAKSSPTDLSAVIKHVGLDGIGASLLLTDPLSGSARDTSYNRHSVVRAIPVDAVMAPSSGLSEEELCDLVDKLASKSTDDALERKGSVVELTRDDGEWMRGSSPPTTVDNGSNLYLRITELHQTAEMLYQFTKRTTETVLHASSLAMPPSQLERSALGEA